MSREQSRRRHVTQHALSNSSTSLPESVSGPALLVVIQWLIHGGADRATLELLQGIKRLAPQVRCYLVTTVPAKMEWVDEVHRAVDAVFSLPDMAPVEAEKDWPSWSNSSMSTVCS